MPVIVISNQTLKGADVALRALEFGAVDVMAKPSLSNELEIAESRIQLVDKVRSAYYAKNNSAKKIEKNLSGSKLESSKVDAAPIVPIRPGTFSSHALIAVGASTGGTEAIKSFLEVLPSAMPPILVVQHMPEKFTASFARRLNDFCALHVKEAEDGEQVLPNTVYIAPGSHHMVIQSRHGKSMIKTYQGELVNRHRPSVNVLFHSVAEAKGKHAIGIIMTGMGDDGATGMLAMHQKGAHTIAQDEFSSVVFGMPQKAILAGGVSIVLPLSQISREVCDTLHAL